MLLAQSRQHGLYRSQKAVSRINAAAVMNLDVYCARTRYPIRMTPAILTQRRLSAGMVGLGMIFDDTYRPLFEQLHAEGLYRRDFGLVDVELTAVASRTGSRAERYKKSAAGHIADFASFAGEDALQHLIRHGVDAVCIATPDNRHFEAAK